MFHDERWRNVWCTSGMNMGTMPGTSMTGMDVDDLAMNLSTPWYSNPWLLLGWALLALIATAISIGIVFGMKLIIQRSRPNHLADIS